LGSVSGNGGNFAGMRRIGTYGMEVGLAYDGWLDSDEGNSMFEGGGTGLRIREGSIRYYVGQEDYIARMDSGGLQLWDGDTTNSLLAEIATDGGDSFILNGNFGLGTTAPVYKLDVNGDVRVNSTSDFYVGNVGLNDTGSGVNSGARLVGLYTGGYINIAIAFPGTGVQSVLDAIDSVLGSFGS